VKKLLVLFAVAALAAAGLGLGASSVALADNPWCPATGKGHIDDNGVAFDWDCPAGYCPTGSCCWHVAVSFKMTCSPGTGSGCCWCINNQIDQWGPRGWMNIVPNGPVATCDPYTVIPCDDGTETTVFTQAFYACYTSGQTYRVLYNYYGNDCDNAGPGDILDVVSVQFTVSC
jgi:hypothetical protein